MLFDRPRATSLASKSFTASYRDEKRRSASSRAASAPGFCRSRIAVNEGSDHPQPPTKLDIGLRVTDQHAACRGNPGKIRHSLFEKPRQRLAAVALPLVVRAKVEAVHVRPERLQHLLERGMKVPQILSRVESQPNAALAPVDALVVFGEPNPLEMILVVRPDVIVKGGDYGIVTAVGAQAVQSWGRQVKMVPTVERFSTTRLIARSAGK